jgi:hypothetical protein
VAAAAERLAPPALRPEPALPGHFSAARAWARLVDLVAEGSPHPTGSAAGAQVRERVIAALRQTGYEPRVEPGFVRRDGRATVQNVVAELPGREPGRAVLLAAHYDSVREGPGVSDDLVGVAAVLEVARILKAEPRPRNPVIFLLDEGEESGLLGARAFVRSSPEAPRVAAVVNLDARGTAGPSLMFETGPNNAWLLPAFTSVPHPATSSVFPILYGYLPNATDFAVFRQRGLSGFNFAFIERPDHHHTAVDDLAHASRVSLQHHGDNALATVRALARTDLSRRPAGEAVFFDLLGYTTVWWPAPWGIAMAAAALLLVAGIAVRRTRGGGTSRGSLLRGLLALPAGLLAARLAAIPAWRLLSGAGVRPGPAQLWVAGILALLIVTAVAAGLRRAGWTGLWSGIWLWWAGLGLALALALPGASYLFLVPALAAGLLGTVGTSRHGEVVATALPAGIAVLLWAPIVLTLHQALGTAILPAITTLVAFLLSPLTPLLAAASRRGTGTASSGSELFDVI